MASPFDTPSLEFEQRISKDEALLIAEILHSYRNAFDFTTPHFDDYEELKLAYDAFVDPDSHVYRYNPTIQLVFSLVEDYTSTIINALFERERIIDVTPVEEVHSFRPNIRDEEIARQLQTVLNLIMLHPDTDLLNETVDFVKQAAMYGNSYSMTLPRFKRENGRLIYLGPKLMTKDVYNILGDPQARKLTDGRFIFEIEHIGYKELKRREDN